jgi:hypothetical protein
MDEGPLRLILAGSAESAESAESAGYFNRDRPHRALRLETPRLPQVPCAGPIQSVRARPVLHGLHHVYECAA